MSEATTTQAIAPRAAGRPSRALVITRITRALVQGGVLVEAG